MSPSTCDRKGPLDLTAQVPLPLIDPPADVGHLLISSPTFFPRHAAGLEQHRNTFRWAGLARALAS